MNDEELYFKAKKRIENMKRKNDIADNEIIIELEKEIEYYRERIRKFLDKPFETKNNNNSIEIGVQLNADEAIQKLETMKGLVEEIEEQPSFELLEEKQKIDFEVVTFYDANGNQVKEHRIQYK